MDKEEKKDEIQKKIKERLRSRRNEEMEGNKCWRKNKEKRRKIKRSEKERTRGINRESKFCKMSQSDGAHSSAKTYSSTASRYIHIKWNRGNGGGIYILLLILRISEVNFNNINKISFSST